MKSMVLIGMKAAGKTTVGKLLALKLSLPFVELDKKIEEFYQKENGEKLACREIFSKFGEEEFRKLETEVLGELAKDISGSRVLSCGGGTPLSGENQLLLKQVGVVVFLDVDEEVLLPRIMKHGLPAFFPENQDSKMSLQQIMNKRRPVYEAVAGVKLAVGNNIPEQIVEQIIREVNL